MDYVSTILQWVGRVCGGEQKERKENKWYRLPVEKGENERKVKTATVIQKDSYKQKQQTLLSPFI